LSTLPHELEAMAHAADGIVRQAKLGEEHHLRAPSVGQGHGLFRVVARDGLAAAVKGAYQRLRVGTDGIAVATASNAPRPGSDADAASAASEPLGRAPQPVSKPTTRAATGRMLVKRGIAGLMTGISKSASVARAQALDAASRRHHARVFGRRFILATP